MENNSSDPESAVGYRFVNYNNSQRRWRLETSLYEVQHLIEECLIFNMSKEECMEALSKHANITPVITATVWNELEKENKEFFEAYSRSQKKEDRMSETETNAMIKKIVSDHDHNDDDDDDEENPKDPED